MIQTPHFDESVPSRSGRWSAPCPRFLREITGGVSLQQGSWSDGRVLTGGAGHNAHTKGTTGFTRLKMRSKVGGVRSPTGRFSMERTFVRIRATWEQAVVIEGN